ncbi:MAG: hypothetical protein LUC89_01710 [Oscillospiraceae bacterium]|nr:hypothetical protein [Oscillospiraceae bacterium]
MKKLISLLMVLTLIVGLFSCLGVAASAAEDYEFTFLVTSAAGVEDDDYDDIAAVRSAYIEERGDAMLVSVDEGGDAYGMAAAGYELAWANPYALDNLFTGIYPDKGIYTSDYSGYQGTTWVQIGLPVGGDYADKEGYANVYFVAVGGENDETTLASFAEADGYVVAIGPWSAAEAVEEAEDVDMFWTVVDDEEALAELEENNYMMDGTLVVNAGSTADTVAVVSIFNGTISLEGLTDAVSAVSATEDETTSAIAVSKDTASWTLGSEDGLVLTLTEDVTPASVMVGDTELAEATDYVYAAETLAVTISTDYLNTLEAGEYTVILTDENDKIATVALTIAAGEEPVDDSTDTGENEGEADETTIDTLTLTVEDYDVTITWTKGSEEDLPTLTCTAAVESLALYNGDTLLLNMTEGTDYTLSEDGTVITFTADWLNGLFADETVYALIQAGITLTVVPTYVEETATITLAEGEEDELTWDADSTDGLTVALGEGSSLASVTVGGTALTEGTEYSFENNTLTISADYLSGLEAGTYTIVLSAVASDSGIMTVSEDDTTTITLTLTVTKGTTETDEDTDGTTDDTDTTDEGETVTATISADTDSESWSLGGSADLTVTLSEGSTLTSVSVDGTELTAGTDYKYDESTLTLTIYASYLNTLTAGEYTITLSAGTDDSATIALSAVAVTSISVTGSTAAWTNGTTTDLTITLGDAVTLDSVKVGDTALTESTQYTYDGNVTVTILADYLNKLEAGTYTITLTDGDGDTATVTLTVEAAAATASPSPTPTATATATATATPSYTYTWSRGTNSSTLTVDLGKSVSQIDIYSGTSVWKTAVLNEDYTLSGTAITFNATMVNNDDGTLFWPNGTYRLGITFTDGTTQEIYIVLTDGVESTDTDDTATTDATATAPATSSASPDTGDTTRLGLYVVVLIVLVVALAVVIILVMKGRKQAQPEQHTRSAQPMDDGDDGVKEDYDVEVDDDVEEDYDVSDIDDDDNE